tara:strand:+ start:216 stop:446 length:231 start_codon:yes stop_codon:yes gene_type:complete
MSPEQEAVELVNKYYNLFSIGLESYISMYEAAQCALEAVDVILNADIPITDSEDADAFYNYWTQVYNELEKYEGIY